MGRRSIELYQAWNDAIAEVVYPPLVSPAPVYLDLEDKPLLAIAAKLGIPQAREAAETSLVEAASWALGLDDPSRSVNFDRVTAAVSRWAARQRRGTVVEPPPVLPVLAVLSLAAERMSASDTMSDSNFYGRLNELLGLSADDTRVQGAYRNVAERLWHTLNLWLDSLGGTRGTPTAYALGKRYVGLPLSQALVRQTDREKLPAFFAEYGLAPGSTLAPESLVPLFDQWLALRSGHMSNHVRRAWNSHRAAVAEAVAGNLASWDGTLPETHRAERRTTLLQVRLALDVRGFPSKRMHLEPQVPLSGSPDAGSATLHTADGQTRVDLLPAAPGWAVLAYGSEVANDGLLSGELRLVLDGSPTEIVHRPRRLMAFHQDAATSRWISADRVHLGQEVKFLVREELVQSVTTAFEECARPGWTSTTNFPGLPDGWTLYQGVQLFRSPSYEGFDDLSLLAPSEKFHAELAGGFQLPSATRRTWHVWDPPEVRVSSEKPVTAQIWRESADLSGETADVKVWEEQSTDGMLVFALVDLGLEPGPYRFEVRSSASAARTSNRFLLVSGNQHDALRWSFGEPVQYELNSPLGALGAVVGGLAGPKVQGLMVSGAGGITPPAIPADLQPPTRRPWEGPKAVASGSSTRRLHLVGLPSDSCLYTGRHHEVIDAVPTNKWGKVLSRYQYGRCKVCGLERRYLSRPRDKRWTPQEPTVAATVAPPELPPASGDSDRIVAWDRLLDSLYYLGRGSARDFAKVAANVEPGPLFAHQAMNTLEALGHLDLARDPVTLEVVRWEVSPTSVNRVDDDWRLVGYWPNDMTDEVMREHFLDLFEAPSGPDGPTSWFFSDPSDSDLEQTTADDLLQVLPRLADVVAHLPRRSTIATESARWCDPADGRWQPIPTLAGIGAFRVDSYASRYLLRSERDRDEDTCAPATAYLAKHSAPLILGRMPLLAYTPATETMAVPRGADLPGLYQRAVVCATGLMPVMHGSSLVYEGVSADLARHITWLLTDREGVAL